MARMQKACSTFILWLFSIISAHADVTFGVVFFDPPFVYSATQGFNVDLAKAVCKGLNEPCQIVNKVWKQLFDELDKQSIDVLVGAYITPERAEKYLFTKGYMPSQGRFITLNSATFEEVSQLKGSRVGIIAEEAETGVFHNYIALTYPNLFTLVNYKDLTTLLEALSKNRVNAAVVHNKAVTYWLMNSNNQFKTIGPAFNIGEGIGMLTLPKNKNLLDAINLQLRVIKSNGVYDQIYNTYF